MRFSHRENDKRFGFVVMVKVINLCSVSERKGQENTLKVESIIVLALVSVGVLGVRNC